MGYDICYVGSNPTRRNKEIILKKLLLSIALLLSLAIASFAQDKSVEDITGKDWISFTQNQKQFYIIGFITANSVVIRYLTYIIPKDVSDAERKEITSNIMKQFLYPAYVFDIMLRVDNIYQDETKLKYPIWQVILAAYDKDFWNKIPSGEQKVPDKG